MNINIKLKLPLLNGEGSGTGIGGKAYKYITMEEIERDILPLLGWLTISQSIEVYVNNWTGVVKIENTYKWGDGEKITKYELPIQTSPGMSIQEQMAAEVTFLKRFSLITDFDLKMKPDTVEVKKKKPLAINTPDWRNVVTALQNHTTTIKEVLEIYNVSESNIKILESL